MFYDKAGGSSTLYNLMVGQNTFPGNSFSVATVGGRCSLKNKRHVTSVPITSKKLVHLSL